MERVKYEKPTLDNGQNNVVIDEFLSELSDLGFFLKDLRLLGALLLGQVLHDFYNCFLSN